MGDNGHEELDIHTDGKLDDEKLKAIAQDKFPVTVYLGAADVENTCVVRFCKWILGSRLQEKEDHADGRLFLTGEEGELQVSMSFMVVCIIPLVDCALSIDNVTAQVSLIKNVYVNLTSCIM